MNAHAALSVGDLLLIEGLDPATRAAVERYAGGIVGAGNDLLKAYQQGWIDGADAALEEARYVSVPRPPTELPKKWAAV